VLQNPYLQLLKDSLRQKENRKIDAEYYRLTDAGLEIAEALVARREAEVGLYTSVQFKSIIERCMERAKQAHSHQAKLTVLTNSNFLKDLFGISIYLCH